MLCGLWKLELPDEYYVSICSDILLDPTGTYGSGIKDWKSIGWVVSSNANDKTDIVYIEAHLNSNFFFLSPMLSNAKQLRVKYQI